MVKKSGTNVEGGAKYRGEQEEVPTQEVPVLKKSRGKPEVDGVFNSLYDWQLKYKVIAMS